MSTPTRKPAFAPPAAVAAANSLSRRCRLARQHFSAYLDGALSGREMASLARHMRSCSGCTAEFEIWRSIQTSLGDLRGCPAPSELGRSLRAAVAEQRERGAHLSAPQRMAQLWERSLAALALRAAAGLSIATVLLGGFVLMFGPALNVQANDDGLAHLIAPHYLYSQVPPRAIDAGRDVPILVDAKVDSHGRVYDFNIIEGPTDPNVRLRVEDNLLSSVFRPATVFGVPVRGHVMMTYTGVSVRG